jgi:carbon-monoxide dehydrogenase medium subunit
VTRLPSAERVLHSGRLDDQLLRHAGDAAAKEAILLSDAHGSAAYKRELLRVHLGRAVRQAADGTGARQS